MINIYLLLILLNVTTKPTVDVYGGYGRVRNMADSSQFKNVSPVATAWETTDSVKTTIFGIDSVPPCSCAKAYISYYYGNYVMITDSIDTIVATPCTSRIVRTYRNRGYQLGTPQSKWSDLWVKRAFIDSLIAGKMVIDTMVFKDSMVIHSDTSNTARNALKLGGLYPSSYLLSNSQDTAFIIKLQKLLADTAIIGKIIGSINYADSAGKATTATTAINSYQWNGHSWGIDRYPYCHIADSASMNHATLSDNSIQWAGRLWNTLYPRADTAYHIIGHSVSWADSSYYGIWADSLSNFTIRPRIGHGIAINLITPYGTNEFVHPDIITGEEIDGSFMNEYKYWMSTCT